MWRALVLLAAVSAVKGQTTPTSPCLWFGGEQPINTYIEGCLTPPCLLPQGQDVVLNIIFRVPRTMTHMTTAAGAFVPPIPLPVPYPLGAQSQTCNFLENSFCPVIEGEILKYTLSMHIEDFFPAGTNANIEFRVQADNNSPFICIRVPISIVPPVNSRQGNHTVTAN